MTEREKVVRLSSSIAVDSEEYSGEKERTLKEKKGNQVK